MSTTSPEELQARAESVRRLTLQAVESLALAKTAALQLAQHAHAVDVPTTFSYPILDAAECLAHDIDEPARHIAPLDRRARELVALTEALLQAAESTNQEVAA